jgi:hypothetical protein
MAMTPVWGVAPHEHATDAEAPGNYRRHDIHPFVEAYVMLYAFEGHAFPVDETILDYLRDQGILDEDTSLEDAQKFVEHHLKDEDCYALFGALRQFVFDRPAKPQGTKKKAASK